MASRRRQRVSTGKTGGSQGGQARAPPSSHLDRKVEAAKSILNSIPGQHQRRQVKKPAARMPEIDSSDLTNEFDLAPKMKESWARNAESHSEKPARTLAELKEKRKRMRRLQVHKAIDIDGDGIIDDIELQLSKVLDTLEGEDLDGDGVITEEEILQTKVKKGKEIIARQFLQQYPNFRTFWSDFRDLDDEAVVHAMVHNVDYRMLMSNLANKAMQFELLYDSKRIRDSLRIMATDRERRWQKKKAQLADNRSKLFQAKYNATVNAHRQSRLQEQQAHQRHQQRKVQTFTPLLNPSFKKESN